MIVYVVLCLSYMCCLHSGNMYAGISAPADHAGPSYLVPVVIVVMVVV